MIETIKKLCDEDIIQTLEYIKTKETFDLKDISKYYLNRIKKHWGDMASTKSGQQIIQSYQNDLSIIVKLIDFKKDKSEVIKQIDLIINIYKTLNNESEIDKQIRTAIVDKRRDLVIDILNKNKGYINDSLLYFYMQKEDKEMIELCMEHNSWCIEHKNNLFLQKIFTQVG